MLTPDLPPADLLIALLAQERTIRARLSEAPLSNLRLINRLLRKQRAILRQALKEAKHLCTAS